VRRQPHMACCDPHAVATSLIAAIKAALRATPIRPCGVNRAGFVGGSNS
jgi:hypothetical protein